MGHLQEHQKGILAIIAAAILWSSGGIFIKLITLNTIQLASIRSAFAALVFGFLFRKKLLEVNGFTFINALFYSGILIFFVSATKLTTAANAIFLQYTAPIYVLIFEPMINKTRYEKINIITVALCFAGMLLFFTGEITPGHFTGNIFALLSGVAFAAFLVGMRKNKNDYQFSSIFYGNVLVALVGIPSLTELHGISFSDLWQVAFLGVFQIGIAYVIFGYGLKRVLAIEASLIGMIEPVLNPVWVFIGYGEAPSVMAITGGIIIIAVISIRAFILESPRYKAINNHKSLS